MSGLVILAQRSPLSEHSIRRIAEAKKVSGVIFEERRRPAWEKLRWWFWTLPRRRGLLYCLDRMAFILYERIFLLGGEQADVARFLSAAGGERGLPKDIPVYEVSSVNSPEALAVLGRLQPDIILVMGTSIIKEATIKTARRMMLNIHCGITPQYRGGGNFHALCRGDFENVGVTIHQVDSGIDTGNILYQERVPFDARRDTPFRHSLRCVERGGKLFLKAIDDIERGREKPFKKAGQDGFFLSHTLTEYLRLNRKLKGFRKLR
ncbi:MAG: formyl transferase [Elusimicrobiota bacterium]